MSSAHNKCCHCSFDGIEWDDLVEHARTTSHGVHCQGCFDGEGQIWWGWTQEYIDHLVIENVCEACETHYQNATDLENVSTDRDGLRK